MADTKIKQKELIVHKDKLGQELQEGNYVAASHRNCMYVCKITKINKVMLRIVNIESQPSGRGTDGWLVYPLETIKLEGEGAMFYILKYA